MARVGISITKAVAYRDATQEFSNVYYYETTGGLPTAAQADAMIDEVTAKEKTVHSGAVAFVRGKCWSQVGTPASNNMISQKTLSGVGATTADGMDRERAFLIRWRAGTDSRGNPVYLRKYFHACGTFGAAGVSASAAILTQSTGFSSTQRANMATDANTFNTLTSGGGGWELVAKSGRQRTSGGAEAHKYLEHHQLGDMWR